MSRVHRIVLLAIALSACGDGPTDPPPGGDRLAGAPDDPAAPAIQREVYEPRLEDFSPGHPDLPGLVSHRVSILAVSASATVGGVNALLDELDAEIVGGIPGVAGQAAGLLAVRLHSTTHGEMETSLEAVRSRDFVTSATQDMELVTAEVPGENGGSPSEWAWDEEGVSGTWGLASIRAPQLWNLNSSIRASLAAPVLTGVLDNGFAETHEDLTISQFVGPRRVRSHGTHVSGTIAAEFDNAKGVDGVTPFAALVVRVSGSLTTVGAAIWGLDELVRAQPGVRVVNASLQYPWHLANPIVDVRTDLPSQAKAHDDGVLAVTGLAALHAAGFSLPIVVVAAGNHGTVLPGLDAKFGSPLANAGLALGAAPVIVVESDSVISENPVRYVRSGFSNVNAHLSAPGSGIWSADSGASNRYSSMSGTSMAAPHVTGLISYLYALAPDLPPPSLLASPVRAMLLANVQPTERNGRPQIDAFATALDIDRLRGNDAILRRLLDIDDGTGDGNLRLDAGGGLVTADNPAADGGRIDMADFRRWRDWLLQLENPPGLALDGDANHPKKDPNGDGAPGEGAAYEGLHPRGDFNGDGRMNRTSERAVAGAAGGAAYTDLEVLQQLFDDPDYGASDLPGLIASGEIHLDATDCLAIDGAQTAVSAVSSTDGGPPIGVARTHAAAEPVHIRTLLAPAEYRITLEVQDAIGVVISTVVLQSELAIGEDIHLRPECEPQGGPTVTVVEARTTAAARTFSSPGCDQQHQFAPTTLVLSAQSPVVTCTSGSPSSTTTAQNAYTIAPHSTNRVSVTALGRGTLSGAQAGDHRVLVVVEFTVANAQASFSIGGSIGATVAAQSRFGLPETLDIVVTIEREGGGVVTPAHTFVNLQQGAPPATLTLDKQGTLQPGNYAFVALIEANDLNSAGEFNVTLELGP